MVYGIDNLVDVDLARAGEAEGNIDLGLSAVRVLLHRLLHLVWGWKLEDQDLELRAEGLD